jgi:TetR/AcrR family transcriptional repressor of nem operon
MVRSANNTRQQLVEISADLLCRRGFSGFSYQDLANELGIRKASVHHHFPQKADLGLALCDWTEAWLLDGFQHFDRQASGAVDKLQRYLRAAAKHAFNDDKQCPISALHSDLPVLSEAIRQRLKALSETELNWVAGVFRQGLDNGELRAPQPAADAREMARLFIVACKGALFYARLLGPEHFEQSMALLLRQWLPQTHQ